MRWSDAHGLEPCIFAHGTTTLLVRKTSADSAESLEEPVEDPKPLLLEEARKEAEQIREEARQAGYQEGFERGRKEGRERGMAEAAQADAKLMEPELNAISQYRDSVAKRAVKDVVRVVMSAIEAVHGKEVSDDNAYIGELVRTMLVEVAPRVASVIEVNPLDVDLVIASQDAWRYVHPNGIALRIVPNPALRRGDCRLLTDGGWMERTFSTVAELEPQISEWVSQMVDAWGQTDEASA